MNNQESFHIKVENSDGKEIVIRHGEALPLKEPNVVKVAGDVKAPYTFYKSPICKDKDTVLVIYDNKKGFLRLTDSPNGKYQNEITGSVTENKDIAKLNLGVEYDDVRDYKNT